MGLVIKSNMTGKVKWFNENRGFGFIIPDMGGSDVFVHFSGIIGDGYKTLTEGMPVIYEVSTASGKLMAVNVTISADDFAIAAYHCNDYDVPVPDDVPYQVQVDSVLAHVRSALLSGVLDVHVSIQQRRV